MSAAATLQAVSTLVDLMGAVSHLMAHSQRIASMLSANGGTLSDAQWQQLRSEDAILASALAVAIAERGKRADREG